MSPLPDVQNEVERGRLAARRVAERDQEFWIEDPVGFVGRFSRKVELGGKNRSTWGLDSNKNRAGSAREAERNSRRVRPESLSVFMSSHFCTRSFHLQYVAPVEHVYRLEKIGKALENAYVHELKFECRPSVPVAAHNPTLRIPLRLGSIRALLRHIVNRGEHKGDRLVF